MGKKNAGFWIEQFLVGGGRVKVNVLLEGRWFRAAMVMQTAPAKALEYHAEKDGGFPVSSYTETKGDVNPSWTEIVEEESPR